jgi:hypothetical protein
MSLEQETQEEALSSDKKPIDAKVIDDKKAEDGSVNKRSNEAANSDEDDEDCQNNENLDANPQKKRPRKQVATMDKVDEEEEDAIIKARKVLEMFQREFGDDDDENAAIAGGAPRRLGNGKSIDRDTAVDSSNGRFQRKLIILQDDDPCLL